MALIVNWKTVGPTEKLGSWGGKQLRLVYEDKFWRLFIDGKRVKQKFKSSKAAMLSLDILCNKILKSMRKELLHEEAVN